MKTWRKNCRSTARCQKSRTLNKGNDEPMPTMHHFAHSIHDLASRLKKDTASHQLFSRHFQQCFTIYSLSHKLLRVFSENTWNRFSPLLHLLHGKCPQVMLIQQLPRQDSLPHTRHGDKMRTERWNKENEEGTRRARRAKGEKNTNLVLEVAIFVNLHGKHRTTKQPNK